MKLCKNVVLVFLMLGVCSCSNNLSNSKAESIINECLEIEPIKRTISLQINTVRFPKSIKNSDLPKYEELKDEGYIEMESAKNNAKKPVKGKLNDPLGKWRYEMEMNRYERNYKNAYDVKITNKAQEYIERAPENANQVTMRAFKYVVDEVIEVQEIPSLNTAKVKVKYKAIDKTPFAILSKKDPAEYWITDITMKKTSNGWKYCDNF